MAAGSGEGKPLRYINAQLDALCNSHCQIEQGEVSMSNVYVEPRPKGRPEGTHIDDYVVEDHADHALATFKTQGEAIDWAKKNGHTPHVARVRHLNDKKKADHWRAV
jgi:hypothetical protein